MPYVFPSEQTTIVRRTNFGQRYRKPLLAGWKSPTAASITCGTELLPAGEPVHQVAGLLSHASASVTLGVYSH